METNKDLFAAYIGLTASGYDLAEKSDKALQELIEEIQNADYPAGVIDYFAQARTNRYEINPYWPRGSVISSACFFIDNGVLSADEYERFLKSCNNMDVTAELMEWIKRLPYVVRLIREAVNFSPLWAANLKIIDDKSSVFLEARIKTMKALRVLHGNGEIKTAVVFAPNLLQAPQITDFAKRKNKLTVIAVFPDVASVLHEYLHPVISGHGGIILQKCEEYGFDGMYDDGKMQKTGYLINDTVDAKMRVVEESFVRGISLYLAREVSGGGEGAAGRNAGGAAKRSCEDGFFLVPKVYERACLYRPTIQNLCFFIGDTLDSYKYGTPAD